MSERAASQIGSATEVQNNDVWIRPLEGSAPLERHLGSYDGPFPCQAETQTVLFAIHLHVEP
jgi:hypothetical protein